MKRLCHLAVTCCLLLCCLPTAAGAVGTSASCAILLEADSGRILFEQNIHERRLIASITKLMTALVAAESGLSPDTVVTVGPESCGIEGSSLYLQPGEELTLEALLYGLLMRSGNDAAIAVALACADSQEEFAARMNEKAAQLGMENSHFSNPNGLDAEDHYSTAYDMALLARACLENEVVAAIVSTRNAAFGSRLFRNHNKLLWRYEGCVGLKTGFTEQAGRTLVSAAKRDGMTLIAVTLNDPDDWKDHAALFDYGFRTFPSTRLAAGGEVYARIPLSGGLAPFAAVTAQTDLYCPLASGEAPELRVELEQTTLRAPVARGERAGWLVVELEGEALCRVPLVFTADTACLVAPRQGFLARLLEFWGG